MLSSRLRFCAASLSLTAALVGLTPAPAARAATSAPTFEIDESVGNAGFAHIGPAGNTYMQDMVVQADGKIIVVGDAAGVPLVTRLLPGGSPDPGFGHEGRAVWSNASGFLTAVSVDPAGRVVVALTDISQVRMARFTAGGVLDTGFGDGGTISVPGNITTFAVDAAGRILLGGPAPTGQARIEVIRLTAAGVPDPSFASAGSAVRIVPSAYGTAAKAAVHRIAVAPDGRILVAGSITPEGSGSLNYVARMLDSGSLDTSFGGGGFTVGGLHPSPEFGAAISDAAVLPDGSVVVVGSTARNGSFAASGEYGTFVARYDRAGRLDPNFGMPAGSFRPGPYPGGGRAMHIIGPAMYLSHVLVPDGQDGWLVPISAQDASHNPGVGLVRFDESGRPDNSFDDDGVMVVDPSRDTYELGVTAGVAPGNAVVLATTAQPPPNGDRTAQLRGSIVVSRVHPPPHRNGYWMLGEDGSLWGFGGAPLKGLPGPGYKWVDVEPTPTGAGYWSLASNGTVFSFGNAGKLGHVWPPLAEDPLGEGETAASLSATPSGKGYWIFTTKGRVFPFGDAGSFGDMSKVKLNGPVLDSVATPSGQGYFMVASDGGIFAFGDAAFAGSMGGKRLNAPVQSLVPDGDGTGYWLVASDGGVFAFDAPFRGSMGGHRLNGPVTGMVRFGNGYLMVGTDGGIFNFSDKEFFGSLGGTKLKTVITAVAAIDT